MSTRTFQLLTLTAMSLFLAGLLFFGVYLDELAVYEIVASFILAPFLFHYAVKFYSSSITHEFNFSDKFTRSITLQRVDPLLN